MKLKCNDLFQILNYLNSKILTITQNSYEFTCKFSKKKSDFFPTLKYKLVAY